MILYHLSKCWGKVTHQIRLFSSEFGHLHLDDYVWLTAYLHFPTIERRPGHRVIWRDFQLIWKQTLILDQLSIYSAFDSTHWIDYVSNDHKGSLDTCYISSHPDVRHLKLDKMNTIQKSLKRRNVLLCWVNIFSNISHACVERTFHS